MSNIHFLFLDGCFLLFVNCFFRFCIIRWRTRRLSYWSSFRIVFWFFIYIFIILRTIIGRWIFASIFFLIVFIFFFIITFIIFIIIFIIFFITCFFWWIFINWFRGLTFLRFSWLWNIVIIWCYTFFRNCFILTFIFIIIIIFLRSFFFFFFILLFHN